MKAAGKLLHRGARSTGATRVAKSRGQERQTSSELRRGRLVPASGSKWYAKGDVATDEWLIECKRTDKKQFTLKHEMLLKHKLLAGKEGKFPMWQFEFGSKKYRYAMVPWYVMKRLMKE